MSKQFDDGNYECYKDLCPWWCPGEKECSVKVIAMELIKNNEKR